VTAVPRRRVLHVITRLIVGGAQENTVASVARVAPERYESYLWIGPQLGTEGSLVEEARARGITPVVIPDLVRQIDPVRDARVTAELAGRMRREGFDLVHTHSSKAGIAGRVAAARAGVPAIVHTAHGWGFHDRQHPLKRFAFVSAERVLARRTNCIVSVSEETTRIGIAAGIGKAEDYELIRSGIPRDRFLANPAARARVRAELHVPEDAVVVGSVGRLSAQKNPVDFVRLAARLAPSHPSARFLYVGDGPLRADVERRIAEAGLGERVILAGLRRDVPDLLAATDVFVLTSLWEGLPRVIPQALSCGVPVVAYDVSGIREIVRDGVNGWAVPMGDVDGAAARLDELLRDSALRAAFAARAADGFDPAFSEDDMIRRLEDLYDRLLDGRPVPSARR
jgi:glycosyltransferase involved in cell wall biosynthesis